jgi:hypothetical protein
MIDVFTYDTNDNVCSHLHMIGHSRDIVTINASSTT